MNDPPIENAYESAMSELNEDCDYLRRSHAGVLELAETRQAEIERLREAVEYCIDQVEGTGPRGQRVVSTQTMVAILKQALKPEDK